MLRPVDQYFALQEELAKTCLLFLRTLILQQNENISEAWRYGMPFYCYKGKRFCYLWDWTVSSSEFSKKPVIAITASSMGEIAHQSLLGTLRIIEAELPDELQVHIPFAKTKISSGNKITDEKILQRVKQMIKDFSHLISEKQTGSAD
jgi:hypothetical protein